MRKASTTGVLQQTTCNYGTNVGPAGISTDRPTHAIKKTNWVRRRLSPLAALLNSFVAMRGVFLGKGRENEVVPTKAISRNYPPLDMEWCDMAWPLDGGRHNT